MGEKDKQNEIGKEDREKDRIERLVERRKTRISIRAYLIRGNIVLPTPHPASSTIVFLCALSSLPL